MWVVYKLSAPMNGPLSSYWVLVALLIAQTHSHEVKCLNKIRGSGVGYCAVGLSHSRHGQRQPVPRPRLRTGSQGWMARLELAPWSPPWLRSALLVLPRRMAAKSPDSAAKRFGFLLLIFLFKRTSWLTVTCIKRKAKDPRSWRKQAEMRCGFWATSRLVAPIGKLGDRAICWHRDSDSIPGSLLGAALLLGVVNGFILTPQHPTLLWNCLCKRLRILY